MISGQQLKQVLTYTFAGGTTFLGPTGTFVAIPSTYTVDSLPPSVTLEGSLLPNDALNITWTITDGIGNTLVSGLGNTVSFALPSVPNTVSNNVYNWNITYEDTNGGTYTLILSTVVLVTASAKFGQLNGAGLDIIVPGDLTPLIEATFTVTDQVTIINLFAIVAPYTGRLVIVIPDSYGTVTDIQDNTDSTVLSQFNVVVDAPNNRKIYTTINAVTPDTYYYKIIF
jgi:hypothetical protein